MPLLANVGVPMLYVYAPVLAVAFVPVVLVESAWLTYRIERLRFRAAIGPVTAANLVSTVIGVPLTWCVLVLIQMSTGGGQAHGVGVYAVTWQAPWLIPYEEHLDWMIPSAGLVLTIPFCAVSVMVELFVLRRLLRLEQPRGLCLAVWTANLMTYGMIAGVWLVMLAR